MKWLRYCFVVLSFIMFSSKSFAGENPIGWSYSGTIPAKTVAHLTYAPITYTFINNMPFQMPTPLYINKVTSKPVGEFIFTADTCSGVRLMPKETCVVTFSFVFVTAGKKTVQLVEEYGRNIVPLPEQVTTVSGGPSPLITGTVTIPLPATMGAGSSAPFQFTYTNNNNGTVTGVASSPANVTVNPNPGGGGTVSGITDTCMSLPGHEFTPGESCTVSGTFTAGEVGMYTVHDFITYNGGTGTTALSTSTNTAQDITGVPSTPLPLTMGEGEQEPFGFTYTNNSAEPIVLPSNAVVVTSSGGTTSAITNGCDSATLGPAGSPTSSCTVSGTFSSGATTGPYSVTGTLTYVGGTVVVTTTSTYSSAPLITGAATTPLPQPPEMMGAGEEVPVVFTFTNVGTGTVYGVSIPTPSATGGTFVDSTNCGSTLAAGASCTVMGTFTSGVPGAYSVTGTFNWAGGTFSVTTSDTGTILVTGSATTPLPSDMGAGEEQPFTFTFTNTATTGTAVGLSGVTFTQTGGQVYGTTGCTGTPSGSCTSDTMLAAGASCTISGTFCSGVPSSYSVTATLTYAGGPTSATTPSSPGTSTVKVVGSYTPGLPSATGTGTGEYNTVVITYTNDGTGTAYNIISPTSAANLSFSNGSCSSTSTTCGTTLGGEFSGSNTCTVTCTDFESYAAGTASVTSTLTYAGGTVMTTPPSTTSTVTQSITPSTPIPLPSAVSVGVTYPIQFAFTNTGPGTVYGGTGAQTPVASPGSPDSTIVLGTTSGCSGAINSGSACVVNATFTAIVAGSYSVYDSYTYDGGTLTTSTGPSTASFARLLTINNYCGTDVWYSFNGDSLRKGCSNKNPCPKGSMCNTAADGGAGVCYWTNPSPTKGGFHLGAMTGITPATSKVLVPDLNASGNTVWSGTFAGRTGCNGKACETADCGSGDKTCPVGSAFAGPTTIAQLTLMRNASDNYAIYTGNGINLSMSVGPTNPEKTTPAYNSSAPYYCATPGSADAKRIFNACSWTLKPPAYPNASSAVDYVWVKPGMGGACSTNSCPASEVCGLSFNSGKFAQVCGKKLGYWTANQACLLNAQGAKTYFDCKNAMTMPAGELLKALNTCASTEAQSAICAAPGLKEKASMVRWIKSACSSVSAFPGDTNGSAFTCNTEEPTNPKSKIKVKTKMNVTEYTISFCPELAPNSPFRGLQAR